MHLPSHGHGEPNAVQTPSKDSECSPTLTDADSLCSPSSSPSIPWLKPLVLERHEDSFSAKHPELLDVDDLMQDRDNMSTGDCCSRFRLSHARAE
ncbi:hypothetical protein DACRYDRAFT_20827 [Dacryopinax primogenitus]|uniref:Uncharacterized protein n=1 Tax=Dacryopinax primogenitus (strain DJM 731) TaxID=1858805 RepID=M5GD37_DACPD|nr:uncharacterized protein DACRYDRAFT_20827 [Dacryopinax primogenitus]EJU04227.1 hypothetical protein DACRYDRAFT_20827 [Dacryopinax primogenitus]